MRKSLYMSLVRSCLSYCSQVWAPQSVTTLYSVERIQRRASKFILSLPFRTDVSYKERLTKLRLLPLCYWHEYLDIVYLFKSMSSDPNISILNTARTTRRTDPSRGTILNVPRSNTTLHQNNFYCRAPKVWNSLPPTLRNRNLSIDQFKKNLFSYYANLTKLYFDINLPQTFKTVCVKCHTCRPIASLGSSLCC